MSSPERAHFYVIGDGGPPVSYSGGWFLDEGSFGTAEAERPTHRHALRGIKETGTMSLSFNGAEILVSTVSVGPPPDWTCYIDGASARLEPTAVAIFGPSITHSQLCWMGALGDGPHALNISITSASQDSTFWLHRIAYAPPVKTLLPISDATFLPVGRSDHSVDHGPHAIVPIPDIDLGYSGKKHRKKSVHVTFIGTSVSWYATTPASFPETVFRGRYSIDGGKPTLFFWSATTRRLKDQLIFTTSAAAAGKHRLTVTFLGPFKLPHDGPPLFLNYLIVHDGKSAPGRSIYIDGVIADKPSLPSETTKPVTSSSTRVTVSSTSSTRVTVSSTPSNNIPQVTPSKQNTTRYSSARSTVNATRYSTKVITSTTLYTSDVPPASSASEPLAVAGIQTTRRNAMIGGIVGLLVLCIIIIVTVLVWNRRRMRGTDRTSGEGERPNHTSSVLLEVENLTTLPSPVRTLRSKSGRRVELASPVVSSPSDFYENGLATRHHPSGGFRSGSTDSEPPPKYTYS